MEKNLEMVSNTKTDDESYGEMVELSQQREGSFELKRGRQYEGLASSLSAGVAALLVGLVDS